MTKYNKPALSFAEQVDLLLTRGLIISNRRSVEKVLANISYYRLSAYMLPFKICQKGVVLDKFVEGTTWEMIYDLYKFDRKLRLLMFDAIESIEVAIRAQIVNQLSMKYGSHWQDDKRVFKSPVIRHRHNGSTFIDDVYTDIQEHIKDRLRNDRSETFIQHYKTTYSEPQNPPSWMSVEILYFSQLSRICDGLKQRADIAGIAKYFSLPPQTFRSWLHAFNFTRNLCAHHSRIWNRDMNIVPEKLGFSKRLKWISDPDTARRNKVYYSLCMIYYMLQTVNPKTHFKRHLFELLDNYSHVANLNSMGFPKNWEEDDFWK